MQNAKTPFALDDNGKIFDYATSKQLDPDGIYATAAGVCYDMAVLAVQIQRGLDIDEAIVGRVPATGEGHWVFEGDPISEVSARDAGDAEARGLREEIEAQKAVIEGLHSDNAELRGKLQQQGENNLNEARRMASAGEPLIADADLQKAQAAHQNGLREASKDFQQRKEEIAAEILNKEFGHDANGSPTSETAQGRQAEQQQGGDATTS